MAQLLIGLTIWFSQSEVVLHLNLQNHGEKSVQTRMAQTESDFQTLNLPTAITGEFIENVNRYQPAQADLSTADPLVVSVIT